MNLSHSSSPNGSHIAVANGSVPRPALIPTTTADTSTTCSRRNQHPWAYFPRPTARRCDARSSSVALHPLLHGLTSHSLCGALCARACDLVTWRSGCALARAPYEVPRSSEDPERGAILAAERARSGTPSPGPAFSARRPPRGRPARTRPSSGLRCSRRLPTFHRAHSARSAQFQQVLPLCSCSRRLGEWQYQRNR